MKKKRKEKVIVCACVRGGVSEWVGWKEEQRRSRSGMEGLKSQEPRLGVDNLGLVGR